MLRETIMGPELFDKAFKEYSNRWMYKHPKPADFFRTMEDASGVDLDWFWRGWWFSTDKVNMSIEDVKWFRLNNPKSAEKTAVGKGDLSSGPMPFTVIDTPPQMYGEFRGTIDDNAIRQKLEGKTCTR